jgi:lipopolysaccharide biosynthesis glycosyltransferase
MDAAWNVTSPVFDLPSHENSCYEQDTFKRIRKTPAMLHFAGPQKPWQYGNKHPFVQAYFDVIDRTQWSGWRPMPESRSEESTRKTGWKEWLLNWHRHKAAKKAA